MKYPYRYETYKQWTRIIASQQILIQLLRICRGEFGNNLHAIGIFMGHWYIQFPSKEMAHRVTKVWREGEQGEKV